MSTALLSAFGVVFVAELGDKTQLLAMNFGAQYSMRKVIVGLAVGYGAAGLVAVAIGGMLGASLPERPVEVAGGLIFIAFGILSLVSGDDDDDDGHDGDGREGDRGPNTRGLVRSSVVATIGLAIFIAEMGDKTQIATATLAARSDPLGTWIGATAGEVASGMIGVFAGSLVGDRIPPSAMRWASSVLFVLFGLALLTGFP